MLNLLLVQDTVKNDSGGIQNTLQFLEEQDVVVPKKKKKYFILRPDTLQKTDSVPAFSSTAQSLLLPQKKDTAQKEVFTKSIFGNHLLIQKDAAPAIRKIENHDWIILVISAAVVLTMLLRSVYPKKFRSNFKLLFSGKAVTQMMREERAFMNRASFSLSLCFLIIVPLFLFQVNSYFGIRVSGNAPFIFYLKTAGTVITAYAAKIVVMKAIGGVFEVGAVTNENIFLLFLFNEMLGIFLLPVVIGIAFTEIILPKYFICLGLGLWGVIWIYRNFRVWMSKSAEGRVSKFYLLLYLCTLEILPLLILFKWLKK